MSKNWKVWYLYHSGYAVETPNAWLVFDFWKEEPATPMHDSTTPNADVANGIFVPAQHRDKPVYVFSSHKHPDHFNPFILTWRGSHPHLRYILSSDIAKRYTGDADTLVLKPGENVSFDGMQIKTLKSTDAGVAFCVTLTDGTIYHAGDLNWWHWEGEDKAWNNNMAARYKKEIAQLEGFHADVAFLTVDPRLEADWMRGIRYFMEQVKADQLFPMHFGDDPDTPARMKQALSDASWVERLHIPASRGASFSV